MALLDDVARIARTALGRTASILTRLSTAESSIGTLQTDLDNAESDIATNTATIASHTTTLGSHTSSLSSHGTRLDDLEAFVNWRSLQYAAAANTFFTIEDLGTVAQGDVWMIDAVVGAGKKPAAATTTRQSACVRVLGTVDRATGGAAPTVTYTIANADGGALAGWSTGVRLQVVSNNIEIQGRVTVADTLHVRWHRSVNKNTIA